MKKTKPQKNIWNKILKNPLWYLFLIFVLVKGGYEIYNNYRLERYGICTQAIVQKTYQEMHKRITIYKFCVENKAYSGKSIYDRHLDFGDTLDIVYIPFNPKINRSNKTINKHN